MSSVKLAEEAVPGLTVNVVEKDFPRKAKLTIGVSAFVREIFKAVPSEQTPVVAAELH